MSLHIFVAICILSIDFMIYAFFQWTYGDKRSAITRKLVAHKNAVRQQSRRPFLVPPQEIRSAPPQEVLFNRSLRSERQPAGLSTARSYHGRLA
jgi:hypothetical protein